MTGIVKSESDKKIIYTHDEAARIIDMFEEILEQHNVRIPSPEDEERDSDNAEISLQTLRQRNVARWSL